MHNILRMALLCLILCSGAAHPAQLTLSGAIVTGATGVLVGTQLYNVQFLAGTCAGLFSGCDSVSDFVFTNRTQADLASRALLDQVIHASATLDADPRLMQGCTDATGGLCSTGTPYGPTTLGGNPAVFYSAVTNWKLPSPVNSFGQILLDSAGGGTSSQLITNYNGSGGPSFALSGNWAKWSVAPVPEPSEWVMLVAGFGLLGTIASLKRRQQRPVA